jgi:hypothetical protein
MLSGLNDRECHMNLGKSPFAQGMKFAPWKTSSRIIGLYKGHARERTLGCAGLGSQRQVLVAAVNPAP